MIHIDRVNVVPPGCAGLHDPGDSRVIGDNFRIIPGTEREGNNLSDNHHSVGQGSGDQGK